MPTDALDAKIEQTRHQVEDARAQFQMSRARLAELELKLSTYEEAARLRPGNRTSQSAPSRSAATGIPRSTGKRGGRQPGAISRKWQTVLKGVASHFPDGATPADIASFGPSVGLQNLKPKDARQQADKYVELGYMERAGDRYRITPFASGRYELNAAAPSEASTEPADGQLNGVELPESETATDSQSVAAPELSIAERA